MYVKLIPTTFDPHPVIRMRANVCVGLTTCRWKRARKQELSKADDDDDDDVGAEKVHFADGICSPTCH